MTLAEFRAANPVGELKEPIAALLDGEAVVTVTAILERTAVYYVADEHDKALARLDRLVIHREPELSIPKAVLNQRKAAKRGREMQEVTRMKQAAAGWRT